MQRAIHVPGGPICAFPQHWLVWMLLAEEWPSSGIKFWKKGWTAEEIKSPLSTVMTPVEKSQWIQDFVESSDPRHLIGDYYLGWAPEPC